MSPSLDYAKARETMVEQQVRPWDVLDPRVLDVLACCRAKPSCRNPPRAGLRRPRTADRQGERSWKPVLDGRALQAPLPAATESVLEIGTGSGYLTACFGRLAREVTSLERHAGSLRPRARAHRRARLRPEHRDRNRRRVRVGQRPPLRRDLRRRRGRRDPGALPAVAEPERTDVRGARPRAGDGSRARDARNGVNDAHPIVVRNRIALPRRGRPGSRLPVLNQDPACAVFRSPSPSPPRCAARRRPRRRPDADLPAGAPERSAIRRRRGQPRGRRRESGAGARALLPQIGGSVASPAATSVRAAACRPVPGASPEPIAVRLRHLHRAARRPRRYSIAPAATTWSPPGTT